MILLRVPKPAAQGRPERCPVAPGAPRPGPPASPVPLPPSAPRATPGRTSGPTMAPSARAAACAPSPGSRRPLPGAIPAPKPPEHVNTTSPGSSAYILPRCPISPQTRACVLPTTCRDIAGLQAPRGHPSSAHSDLEALPRPRPLPHGPPARRPRPPPCQAAGSHPPLLREPLRHLLGVDLARRSPSCYVLLPMWSRRLRSRLAPGCSGPRSPHPSGDSGRNVFARRRPSPDALRVQPGTMSRQDRPR